MLARKETKYVLYQSWITKYIYLNTIIEGKINLNPFWFTLKGKTLFKNIVYIYLFYKY